MLSRENAVHVITDRYAGVAVHGLMDFQATSSITAATSMNQQS